MKNIQKENKSVDNNTIIFYELITIHYIYKTNNVH